MSCYCSASHTDNNYSTDEHDSVRDSSHRPQAAPLTQKLGLHQSDSGADLSEYHDYHEAKGIRDLLGSCNSKADDEGAERKGVFRNKYREDDKEESLEFFENNFKIGDEKLSLGSKISRQINQDDDIIEIKRNSSNYRSELELLWGKFWSKNGEQLIWASWIEKYADYINPEYMQNNASETRETFPEQNTCFPNQAHKDCEINRSNFEGIFSKTTNQKCSESSFPFQETTQVTVNDNEADDNRKKLGNREISPEIGDGWNPLSPFSFEEGYNLTSNTEDERLIAKSRCSSVGESIANTNATTDSMTDVTKMTITSSSFDSNSIQSSSLFSSTTSSIESNITSSSSEMEAEPGMEEVDKYWQQLWKEHFQEQYWMQCKLFMQRYDEELELHKAANSGKETTKRKEFDGTEFLSKTKDNSRRKKMIMESVGTLMQNLTMRSDDSQPMDSDVRDNTGDNNAENGATNTQRSSSGGTKTLENCSSGGDGEQPNEDKPTNLKRR